MIRALVWSYTSNIHKLHQRYNFLYHNPSTPLHHAHQPLILITYPLSFPSSPLFPSVRPSVRTLVGWSARLLFKDVIPEKREIGGDVCDEFVVNSDICSQPIVFEIGSLSSSSSLPPPSSPSHPPPVYLILCFANTADLKVTQSHPRYPLLLPPLPLFPLLLLLCPSLSLPISLLLIACPSLDLPFSPSP